MESSEAGAEAVRARARCRMEREREREREEPSIRQPPRDFLRIVLGSGLKVDNCVACERSACARIELEVSGKKASTCARDF